MLWQVLLWLVIVGLLFHAVRRAGLAVAALLPLQPPPGAAVPSVLVAVSARDEEPYLPRLLDSLENLDYPSEKLVFCLISDGSDDATAKLLRNWAKHRKNAYVRVWKQSVGKAVELNRALGYVPECELVVVYDADQCPEPLSLRRLAAPFDDSKVAAVSGYCRPVPVSGTLVERAVAVEAWVHQFVTQRALGLLGSNVAPQGANCAYRRAVLTEVGGFRPEATGEDVELVAHITENGLRSIFAFDAVCDNAVAETLPRYWRRKRRQTRDAVNEGVLERGPAAWLVWTGSLDTLIFVAGAILSAGGVIHPAWPAAYLASLGAVAFAALYRAGQLARAPLYILAAWAVYPIDVAAKIIALLPAVLPHPGGRSR